MDGRFYPLTKLSEVPPGFIAIKFFASLIRTCSSPPTSGDDFLPEDKTDFFRKSKQSQSKYCFLNLFF